MWNVRSKRLSWGERIGYSLSKKKGARVNAAYQSLIMTAEVNGLSLWKYLEWLLSEIKELEATTAEDFARSITFYHHKRRRSGLACSRISW